MLTTAAIHPTIKADALTNPERDPRPLIHWPRRFGIFWSPKSACTAVLLWYYDRLGLRPAADFHSSWPHDYREQVLYSSKTYQSWLKDADLTQIRWLRVIRDPYKRAVSSYRHAVQFGYMNEKLSADNRGEGFSFAEFLAFLGENGPIGDVHNIPQIHRIESLLPPENIHVLNIDKIGLAAGLAEFENSVDIPNVQVRSAPIKTPDGINHMAQTYETDADLYRQKFNKAAAASIWPAHDAFLSDEAREVIRQVYRVDFEAYRDWL